MRKRIILDIIIIGAAVIGISFCQSYLVYCNFILMPLVGAAAVFRMNKHLIAIPMVIALISYWVAAYNNAPDGPFFIALLFFILSFIGLIVGSLIWVAFFKEPCGVGKKVVLTVIAAAISIVLIVSTFQYIGNPFVTARSGVAIKAYIEDKYPDTGYSVSDPQYDFTLGKYLCSVYDKDGNYIFDVLYSKGELTEDYSVAQAQTAQ